MKGQIYDAISYYFDHKEEIDKEIQENTLKELMKKYNLRFIPEKKSGIGRIVTDREFEGLSEEEKEKAYTWDTLPEEYNR